MRAYGTPALPALQDGIDLNAALLNPILDHFDLRLHSMEEIEKTWEAVAAEVQRYGLDRIEQTLLPAYQQVQRMSELGFLVANSSTTVTLAAPAVRTFLIDNEDQRELFYPSRWVTLNHVDSPDDSAIARVISYNRTTGVLDLEIQSFAGSPGPHNDWQISVGAGVPAMVEDKAVRAEAARATTLGYRDDAAEILVEIQTIAAELEGVVEAIQNGPVASVNDIPGPAVALEADDIPLAGGSSSVQARFGEIDTALAARVTTTTFNSTVTSLNSAIGGKASSSDLSSGLATKANAADLQTGQLWAIALGA